MIAQLEVGRSREGPSPEPCHLLCSPSPSHFKKKCVVHFPAYGDCKMPTGPFILQTRMVPKTTCSLSTFSKHSNMAVAGSQGPQSLVRQRRLHAWVSPGWFRRKCFPRGASHPLRGLVDKPAGAGPLIGREAVKDIMEDPQWIPGHITDAWWL